MSDEIEVKPGYSPDDVAALLETLRGMVDLEEGELYTLRKGKLHHVVPRDDENGLRRIKVMEEAYDAAQIAARRLRQQLRGYRPDPALVASAFVMHAVEHLPPAEADAIAIAYLQRLFSRAKAGETDANAAPDAGRPERSRPAGTAASSGGAD